MGERFGITVATPWYPVPYNRMAGSFVAEHAVLAGAVPTVAADGGVHVVHASEWPGGSAEASAALRPAFDAVLDALHAGGGTRVHGVAGPVDRVPVFTVGGADWGARAEAAVRDVRRAVGGFTSPIVHGHVGYLGGLLAARLAEPGAKVFATEHSTALQEVLAQPAARDHYAELVERAEAVFCVSDLLRRQVLDAVPDPHGRVRVLPNPVDFAGAPRRTIPPERLARWVFVGGVTERKGVLRLARAFAAAARQDPAVSLTMFGAGPLADQVTAIARDANVADRLHLRGVVRHREVLAELPGFDLLLAPSTYETFHLAVPEAVAAGLPVIVTRSGGPQEALAGVEDAVGRFVDVDEDAGHLVEAWRDLSGSLDRLDLDGARATLDARYGRAAITARLAEAYGSPAPDAAPAEVTPDAVERTPPGRVVLLATSGWRRYHVEAELDAVGALGAPAVLVSDDGRLAAHAARAGVAVTAPARIAAFAPGLSSAALSRPAGGSALRRARRLAGRWRRRLLARAGASPAARPAPSVELDAAFLDGATLVLGDCQSMPAARALLASHPGLRPVVELDRVGALAPPADSEAGLP